MDDKRKREIAERVGKATDNWEAKGDTIIRDVSPKHPNGIYVATFGCGPTSWPQAKADTDFAAHARTDIPDLLSALEEAERRIHELERQLEQWTKWGVVEVAVRNPQVAEYCDQWEKRTERAEARVRELEQADIQRVKDISRLTERVDKAEELNESLGKMVLSNAERADKAEEDCDEIMRERDTLRKALEQSFPPLPNIAKLILTVPHEFVAGAVHSTDCKRCRLDQEWGALAL